MIRIHKYVYLLLCVLISLLFVSYMSANDTYFVEGMKETKPLEFTDKYPLTTTIRKGLWNEHHCLGIYDSCFANGTISIQTFRSVIESGIRAVHFAVTVMFGKTVVTKLNKTYSAVKKDKTLSLREVFRVIENHAFKFEVPTYNEPLIVYIDIHSCNPKVFNDIAKQISILDSRLKLDKKYNYNGQTDTKPNFVEYAPLNDLKSNIIFVFKEKSPCEESIIRNTSLYQYANIIMDDETLVYDTTRHCVPVSFVQKMTTKAYDALTQNNRQSFSIAYLDNVSKPDLVKVMNAAFHTVFIPIKHLGLESVETMMNHTFRIDKNMYGSYKERRDNLKPVIVKTKGKVNPSAKKIPRLLTNKTTFDAIGFKLDKN